jgi:hypothetical protein
MRKINYSGTRDQVKKSAKAADQERQSSQRYNRASQANERREAQLRRDAAKK